MKFRIIARRRAALVLLGACLVAAGATSALYLGTRPPLLEAIPFSSAYYDGDGSLLRLSLARDQKYRLFTPLETISPDLIAATLTQEDRHFYRHPGINPFSLARAMVTTYIARTRPIGGSTITMQVVRLRDGLGTRSIGGKLRQIARALQLEAHYSKRDILEAYLNLAPYGANIHGTGAACLIYFNQPCDRLALAQSLALAVIPQNPVRRSPLGNDVSALQTARLRLFDMLPPALRRNRETVSLPLAARRREDLPFLAPHFINGLRTGPGKIETTIDSAIQASLESQIRTYLRRQDGTIDNAAAMLVHYPTMEVRALVGSSDFHAAAIAGQVDGTQARRSPGSALKPFIYALALEQGLIHPLSVVSDDPAFFAEYRPGNFDKRFIGRLSATDALTLSRNVPAIALAGKLSDPTLYDFLQKAGAGFPQKSAHYGLSIAIGGAEIDMRTLVRLYAMLANGGIVRDLEYEIPGTPRPGERILSAEAALLTVGMLRQPPPETLPFAAAAYIPVYWKTGTSNGFRDAWTIGIFGPYVLAVWLGHFDGRSDPGLIGVEAASPLFFSIVRAIDARTALRDEIEPRMRRHRLALVDICPSTGTPGNGCAQPEKGWFIPGKSPFSPPPSVLTAEPDILSPRAGIAYAVSLKDPKPLKIPLEAKSATPLLYWFAGNRFLGATGKDGPLFWSPQPGSYRLLAVDENGNSQSRTIRVIASP